MRTNTIDSKFYKVGECHRENAAKFKTTNIRTLCKLYAEKFA